MKRTPDLGDLGGAEEGLGDGRIARRASRTLAFGTSRRASAGFWRAGQDGQPDQKRRKRALDAFRSEFACRLGTLPGQWPVANERTGQAQLSIGQYDEPGPTVGLFGVAHPRERPVERLFEEAERMLHIEAAHVGAPGTIQVWDGVSILGGMPPQPERLRLTRLLTASGRPRRAAASRAQSVVGHGHPSGHARHASWGAARSTPAPARRHTAHPQR